MLNNLEVSGSVSTRILAIPTKIFVNFPILPFKCKPVTMSRNSYIGIAMGYALDGWGSILHIFEVSTLALRLIQSPILWVPAALSPGVKRAGREFDHSSSFSAEVKKDGAIPHLPDSPSRHNT
jgi:hypothetical protein